MFAPFAQGSHFYLVLFLGLTLPPIFLCYRGMPLLARDRPTQTATAATTTATATTTTTGTTTATGTTATATATTATTTTGTATGASAPEHLPGAPAGLPHRERPTWLDWALATVALFVALYPILPLPQTAWGGGGFEAFLSRQGSLLPGDVVAGVLLLVLVLEAANRTTGWVLPTAALLFFAYAWFGGLLPMSWQISHEGMELAQIVNSLYNEASGFFGVPLDVAATYIVLFTIYGAVLQRTGAGAFFVEFSLSLFRRSGAAPGRTVATSGFLLGTVSGSGTATAVTLGAFAWPILKKAGYPREEAGGMLAAAGIGAILSPPTMGAAAFIIAEYLSVNYFSVLIWALIPTLLYYLGIFLAVEIDARKFGAREVQVDLPRPWTLLRRYGYHFISLAVIVVFLGVGIPPFKAVVYATLVAVAFGLAEVLLTGHLPGSLLEQDVSQADHVDRRSGIAGFVGALGRALSDGVRTALPVIAVCAAAGVITSSIAKTGLAQVLSEFLIAIADAIAPNHATLVILSTVLSALAILVLGLAVPVTASFILAWVVIGPALISLGVAQEAVAMFIFYYAVLSEVSPPTALAAVASAAITGGKVIPTMWQACKYTLPAFLAPMAFVVTPAGAHLLGIGALPTVLLVAAVSFVGVGALAGHHRRVAARACDPARTARLLRRGAAAALSAAGERRRRARAARRVRRGARRAHPANGRLAPAGWPRPGCRGGAGMRVNVTWVVGLVIAAMGAAGLGGHSGSPAGSDADPNGCEPGHGRLSIATGNSTGVYYVVGGGLARLINHETDLRASSSETGASVQNIQQLVKGDYDIAFSLADTADTAVSGRGRFTSPQPVRSIGRIYPNYTQVVVRSDAGIDSIADFKGKRISTGSPLSGTEAIANKLIAAAGLTPGDVAAQRLDLTKTVDGMKDGSIDGLVWSGGLPTSALTDLYTSMGSKVTMLDPTPLLPKLRATSPVYDTAVIPATTYDMPKDVKTVVVPNVLLVREQMPANLACALTTLVYGKTDQLVQAHPAAKDIALDKADASRPIQMHPGSARALQQLRESGAK